MICYKKAKKKNGLKEDMTLERVLEYRRMYLFIFLKMQDLQADSVYFTTTNKLGTKNVEGHWCPSYEKASDVIPIIFFLNKVKPHSNQNLKQAYPMYIVQRSQDSSTWAVTSIVSSNIIIRCYVSWCTAYAVQLEWESTCSGASFMKLTQLICA